MARRRPPRRPRAAARHRRAVGSPARWGGPVPRLCRRAASGRGAPPATGRPPSRRAPACPRAAPRRRRPRAAAAVPCGRGCRSRGRGRANVTAPRRAGRAGPGAGRAASRRRAQRGRPRRTAGWPGPAGHARRSLGPPGARREHPCPNDRRRLTRNQRSPRSGVRQLQAPRAPPRASRCMSASGAVLGVRARSRGRARRRVGLRRHLHSGRRDARRGEGPAPVCDRAAHLDAFARRPDRQLAGLAHGAVGGQEAGLRPDP